MRRRFTTTGAGTRLVAWVDDEDFHVYLIAVGMPPELESLLSKRSLVQREATVQKVGLEASRPFPCLLDRQVPFGVDEAVDVFLAQELHQREIRVEEILESFVCQALDGI
jgi:2-hydroxy-3-keto-5-methylthiopentenyl-1-phosphate phosphatase